MSLEKVGCCVLAGIIAHALDRVPSSPIAEVHHDPETLSNVVKVRLDNGRRFTIVVTEDA